MDILDEKFLIIDFETTTPKGFSPEPIELGLSGVVNLKEDARLEKSYFIKPPAHAPLTRFDVQQTGITYDNLKNAPDAKKVFSCLNTLCESDQYIFVAQNAKYEKAILERFCKKYSAINDMKILDTILLAKHVFKDLSNYKLDNIASKLGIEIPQDRHRALVDCKLTAKVLIGLVGKSNIKTIEELIGVCCINKPNPQMSIFDMM